MLAQRQGAMTKGNDAAMPDRKQLLDPDMALREELRHVRGVADDATPAEIAAQLRPELSALCFSGGGIRSAAFNLGVARALARAKLLHQFDYLSTVSGGGYIGGWLQTLIRERAEPTHAERLAAMADDLQRPRPAALHRLRDFSNFLSPAAGLGSMDIWAGVALYLRNLLLNWMMLLPVLVLAVSIPILHRTAIWQAGGSDCATAAVLLAGWLALVGAVWSTARMLPSHRRPESLPEGAGSAAERAIWSIVLGGLAWALIAPVAVQWIVVGPEERVGDWRPLLLPGLMLAALLLGFGLAWVGAGDDRVLYRRNWKRWVIASAASVLALWLAVWFAVPPLRGRDSAAWLTQFGPVVIILIYALQTSFYLGLRRETPYADLDREWLARMDGTLIAIAAAWAAFAFACISLGPVLNTQLGLDIKGAAGGATAAGAAASGGVAAWMAKQAQSWVGDAAKSARLSGRLWSLAPSLLSVAFLLGLLVLGGMMVQQSLGFLVPASVDLAGFSRANAWFWEAAVAVDYGPQLPQGVAGWLYLPAQLLLIGVCVVLLNWLGRIDINRFSMHGTYRNRLVRAFLGTPRAAHPTRDWYTGFDQRDNYSLAELDARTQYPRAAPHAPVDQGPHRLFPVFNLTLNRSEGGPDGQAERMGISYVATPLRCGSPDLTRERAYIDTARYAGLHSAAQGADENRGIGIGSVMTASGAAASPHWGYHTNTLTAFIMTLFNVRLGLWLPNHASERLTETQLALNRPPNAVRALLADLIGRTTASNQAIYLSDGGHFDNLGLYEMFRRRCELVVVVDAGEDKGCTFFDLGMAIRKAEIDMPVRITMEPMRIRSRPDVEKTPAGALGIAIGTIEYLHGPGGTGGGAGGGDAVDAAIDQAHEQRRKGRLIYIKPSFLPDIPAATRAYGADHPDFPHESTGDQFFSESQFESYHVLGWQQTHKIAAHAHGTLTGLFEAAVAHCRPAAPAPPSSLLMGRRRER